MLARAAPRLRTVFRRSGAFAALSRSDGHVRDMGGSIKQREQALENKSVREHDELLLKKLREKLAQEGDHSAVAALERMEKKSKLVDHVAEAHGELHK